MSAGRWLAYEQFEREGRTSNGPTRAEGGDPTKLPQSEQPSRYPILWRLSTRSLVDLADAAHESVAELIERAARSKMVQSL